MTNLSSCLCCITCIHREYFSNIHVKNKRPFFKINLLLSLICAVNDFEDVISSITSLLLTAKLTNIVVKEDVLGPAFVSGIRADELERKDQSSHS